VVYFAGPKKTKKDDTFEEIELGDPKRDPRTSIDDTEVPETPFMPPPDLEKKTSIPPPTVQIGGIEGRTLGDTGGGEIGES